MVLWTPRKSESARLLVECINSLGGTAKLVHGQRPTGSIAWGRKVNKYIELQRLAAAGVPVPAHSLVKQPGWYARRLRHHEANDLLAELTKGDYYVEPVATTHEFRIHIWDGKSIRAGIKVPRTEAPHLKFRSWSAGWKLDYGQECQRLMRQELRDVSAAAVKAVGYAYGAVDLAIREDKKLVVWEVNSAPGLEGRTVEVYARKFIETYGG